MSPASHPASSPLRFDVVLWEVNVAYVRVMIYLRIVRLCRSHQPLRGSATRDLSQKTWAPRRSLDPVLELAQSDDGHHRIGEIH